MAKASSSSNDGSTQDVQTAESQTKVNAAPTPETSATDPRPVDTVNQPLVYNDGTPVPDPAGADETGSYTLTAPASAGGSTVTVTSAARRDALVARGYTAS